VIPVITPPAKVATATALLPPATCGALIVKVGELVYPDPPFVIGIEVIDPVITGAVELVVPEAVTVYNLFE
jgi:hypothetical protein